MEVDFSRFRPVEMKRLFGNKDKLQKLGWVPNFDLSDTIQDVYHWYQTI